MRYSLNKAAYELQDVYRTKISKTDDLDLREVKSWVRRKRSLWLRNEYNKNRSIDDAVEQDLGAVQMDLKDPDFIGAAETSTVMISRLPIPTTIELHDGPAITRVGPINKLQYNYTPPINTNRIPFLGNGRFNVNSIWSFLWGNHIGIICKGTNSIFTNIITNGLNVVGVFEDITAAARYPEVGDTAGLLAGFSTTKYFDDDSEAPIHDWMMDYMIQELIKIEGNIAADLTSKVNPDSL